MSLNQICRINFLLFSQLAFKKHLFLIPLISPWCYSIFPSCSSSSSKSNLYVAHITYFPFSFAAVLWTNIQHHLCYFHVHNEHHRHELDGKCKIKSDKREGWHFIHLYHYSLINFSHWKINPDYVNLQLLKRHVLQYITCHIQ